MSIFNGRWPEMSSFNIFIKTSHFDHLLFFCFKQTNLCNSLKYSFSLQRLKYININSTVCIRKKEKEHAHTHAVNMHWTHSYTRGILKQVKKWFVTDKRRGRSRLIRFFRNFCTVPLAKHKRPIRSRSISSSSLDFTVNDAGKTVFTCYIQYAPIRPIQTKEKALVILTKWKYN